MEPITLTAIAVFLAPYLKKAGEKVAEKTIETLFDSRQDLAEKFTGLFKTETISLGLSDSASTNDIREQLEARSELKSEVAKKIVNNQDLLSELVEAFRHMPQADFRGISINAKNIGQVINDPTGPITQNNTFS
jgi:hypothetical protein